MIPPSRAGATTQVSETGPYATVPLATVRLTTSLSGGADLPQLAPAIRILCLDAQRRGLRAEDVVILFKKAWAAVPGPEYGPEGTRRGEVLERAITLCIKSYYSTAD